MAEVDVETGETPVRFEHDGERHAWRDYATAAMREYVASSQRQAESGDPDVSTNAAVRIAAAAGATADAMLREERRRRDLTRRPTRRGR